MNQLPQSIGRGRSESRPGRRRAAQTDQGAGQVAQRPLTSPAAESDGAGAGTAGMIAAIAAFAIAEVLLSFPQLAPSVPGTVIKFVSFPLALLAFTLILRPFREAPIYCAIYGAIALGWELSSTHLAFSAARIAIETLQMAGLVWCLNRYFLKRFADPPMVGAWAIAVLLVTAGTAGLTVAAATALGIAAGDTLHLFGGSLGTAWRYWWLGNACTFLCLAGPAASLVELRHRLKLLLGARGSDRRRFIGLTAAVVATTLFAFPVVDMSWRGFTPDVLLALRLIPVPFVMAMTARFRANGAAIAILIFTLIAVLSVTGPAAPANWHHMPMLATPTHVLLLVTTITCMVLAGISRQLQNAHRAAVAASEVKSRFIALLSHELRTPLNAILGFSELMKMQSLRELDEEVSNLDNIHASGQRLLAMIDALLDHAGEGETIFELRKEPLHLASAVAGAVAELEKEARLCDCAVEIDIPEDLFLEADPRALRQIIHVLFGNALRLCQPGAPVVVTARHAGTDTIVDISSDRLRKRPVDAFDQVEAQLVSALVLAHGARLSVRATGEQGRRARLRFFATRAA